MSELYAALEIGTTRTVLAIAEADPNKRLKITCHAEIPSTGVRKSQILSIPDATQSIRSVLREIEKRQLAQGSKVTIANAFLVVSGQHVLATHAEGQALVDGNKVGVSEMHEAQRIARQMPIPKGRELLDIIDQDYALDNRGGLADPKGMSGNVLKLNTLQVHADANRIQDARSAAEGAKLEISEPVFAATCAADAVVEEHEKKNGVLVLDLGGGSTGYAAYVNGYLVSSGVIGVGGDHVTNDIASAFQTTNGQAEALKIETASAELGQYSGESARTHLGGTSSLMESRTISRRALDTVVNARLKELFTVIRETLEEQDVLHHLHAGCILTGGGANLRGIEALAEKELGLSVRKGRPLAIDGLEKEPEPWNFAAIAGALLYAQRTDDSSSLLDGFFRRLFK